MISPEIVVQCHADHPIPGSDALSLNAAVEWWPERTEEGFRHIMNQGPAVGAWRGSTLIGFARAITDGHWHAYIDDVMVHPDWRRHDIATRLVARLYEVLQVPVVTLFCAAELVPLYEGVGFTPTNQVVLHKPK